MNKLEQFSDEAYQVIKAQLELPDSASESNLYAGLMVVVSAFVTNRRKLPTSQDDRAELLYNSLCQLDQTSPLMLETILLAAVKLLAQTGECNKRLVATTRRVIELGFDEWAETDEQMFGVIPLEPEHHLRGTLYSRPLLESLDTAVVLASKELANGSIWIPETRTPECIMESLVSAGVDLMDITVVDSFKPFESAVEDDWFHGRGHHYIFSSASDRPDLSRAFTRIARSIDVSMDDLSKIQTPSRLKPVFLEKKGDEQEFEALWGLMASRLTNVRAGLCVHAFHSEPPATPQWRFAGTRVGDLVAINEYVRRTLTEKRWESILWSSQNIVAYPIMQQV